MSRRPPRLPAARDWALVLAMFTLANPFPLLLLAAAVVATVFGWWALLGPGAAWVVIALFSGFTGRGEDLPGRAIRPAEQPALTSLVRRVAESLEFRSPLLLRVVPEPDASLFRTRVSGIDAFVLVLGWPLVRGLTEAELAAVVTHELAHRRHVAERRDEMLLAARDALVDSLQSRLGFPTLLKLPLLARTQPRCRQIEHDADADAARVAGTNTTRAALAQIALLTTGWDMLVEGWLATLGEDDSYPLDLYDALAVALDDPHLRARLESEGRLAERLEENSIATHPTVAQRMAALPDERGQAWAAGRAVRFDDAAELEAWCVRSAAARGEDKQPMNPVHVLESDPARFEPEPGIARQELQAAIGTASWPQTLAAGVDQLVADPVALGARVDAATRKAPRPVRRLLLAESAAACVAAGVASTLREAGWERASRWTRFALASPPGEVVDVLTLVDDAMHARDPAPLHDLMRAVTGEPV